MYNVDVQVEHFQFYSTLNDYTKHSTLYGIMGGGGENRRRREPFSARKCLGEKASLSVICQSV
jgi:hypothetical protein